MNPNEASANKTLNINTNGTTVLAGKFVLLRLIINTKGASSNVATIYDSTEALGANAERKKGTVDTVNTTGNIELGYPVYDGIYIVTATGTAADLTLVYAETP